jgi:methenyltetrahydrofolate cyclohydrolase
VGPAGGSEPFGAWTLHELQEELASEAPAPGGGPLAGLVVAMAAALVAKVARGSAEVWPEAAGAVERALELRDRAHWLAGADLDAHLRALEALRSTAEDSEAGDDGALGDALAHAAEMPLALAGTAADVAILAAEAAARGIADRSADAQAAALLAAAAARASARLVEVNLTTLPHDERVKAALERARAAEAAAWPT